MSIGTNHLSVAEILYPSITPRVHSALETLFAADPSPNQTKIVLWATCLSININMGRTVDPKHIAWWLINKKASVLPSLYPSALPSALRTNNVQFPQALAPAPTQMPPIGQPIFCPYPSAAQTTPQAPPPATPSIRVKRERLSSPSMRSPAASAQARNYTRQTQPAPFTPQTHGRQPYPTIPPPRLWRNSTSSAPTVEASTSSSPMRYFTHDPNGNIRKTGSRGSPYRTPVSSVSSVSREASPSPSPSKSRLRPVHQFGPGVLSPSISPTRGTL